MLPAVEIPGLTKEDADQRAADLGIDATTVEIIQEADGTFTVRATYPEGMVTSGATSSAPDNSAPFVLNGLSRSAADVEVAIFGDSGATVDVVPEAGGLFTVRISRAPPPALVQPPQAAAPNAPDLDG